MVQLHLADDVAQGGGAQAFQRRDGLIDAVSIQLGVHHLEKHHRVDLDGDIVAGDDGLGREVAHLLFQADFFGDPLDKGDLHMEAGFPGGRIDAQPLDDKDGGLGHDDNVGHHDEDDHKDQRQDQEEQDDG